MEIKSFYSFINNQALLDRLPFTIDFTIVPYSAIAGEEPLIKEVAGLKFPVIDSLLSRESWFFDALDDVSGLNQLQAQLESILISMATELQQACDIKSFSLALSYVGVTPEEIQAHDNFNAYLQNTAKQREELNKIYRQLDNDSYAWLKVTFFILSRADSSWDVSRTTMLKDSEIQDILKLIQSENKGTTTNGDTEAFEESNLEPTGK